MQQKTLSCPTRDSIREMVDMIRSNSLFQPTAVNQNAALWNPSIAAYPLTARLHDVIRIPMRRQRMAFLSWVIGRPITSTKDLYVDELSCLHGALSIQEVRDMIVQEWIQDVSF